MQTNSSSYRRGIFLVTSAGCSWSLTGLLIRHMDAASDWQIIFYRALTLAVATFIFLRARYGGGVRHIFIKAGWTSLLAGILLAATFICFIISIQHTAVANTLFLMTSSPFFTAVIAWLLLGEPVRRSTWAAIGVAMGGITIMVADGLALGTLYGNVMALSASLGFASFSVALRRGRQTDMMPAVCMAGIFSALGAVWMVEGFAISFHDLWLCIAMGTFALALGLMLYTVGSRYVPAAELTLLSLTEVVLGPIWVWLGTGEVPSLLTLAGGVLMLAAIVGLALRDLRLLPFSVNNRIRP